MGITDWFKRRTPAPDPARAWRDAWARAAAARDASAAGALRSQLAALAAEGADVEIEEEMLDGLEQQIALAAELDGGRLPIVETTHRVVAGERCHFTAPASLPDDPAQPSGRVLLTAARATFVGGPVVRAVAWTAVRTSARADRDLLLVRGDANGLRLRFNTFADAMRAELLAAHFGPARRPL